MATTLDSESFRIALIGILVQKLGGRVRLEQADFDSIYGQTLMEDLFPDGSIEFWIQERRAAS